jgi:HEAT repeat protein
MTLAVLLLVWWPWLRPGQPVYGGRPLMKWVEQLLSPEAAKRREAEAAVLALGPRATPLLVQTLTRKDSPLRQPLLAAQDKLPRFLWVFLYRFVKPYEVEQRRALSARALGLLGPSAQPAIPALGQALFDPSPRVRQEAATALGRLGPAAVPVLVEALRDKDEFTRVLACSALRQLGPDAKEALPALSGMLIAGPDSSRRLAASTLTSLGPSAFPALLRVLEQGPPEARPAVIETLAAIASASHEGLLELLRAGAHSAVAVRLGVVDALRFAQPAGRRTVEALCSAMRDPEPEIRLRAVETIGNLVLLTRFVTNALPTLQERLTDQAEPVRQTAREVMRRILSPDWCPAPKP